MTLDEVIACLRDREDELRALGIERLSVFGSFARGEAGPGSDVDLAAEVDPDAGWGFATRFRTADRLAGLLGRPVDLIQEPVTRKPRLQAEIDKDRIVAF